MAQGLQPGKYWISGGIGLRNHFMKRKKEKINVRESERETERENRSESHLVIIIHAQQRARWSQLLCQSRSFRNYMQSRHWKWVSSKYRSTALF